ncbi:MAG: hypothetical protein ACK5HZ_04750 [Macellibacteroides fermentans]|uniref:hypothetical protein n=1 Tax=Macellibacteroides fermentans TaxID=879969 RepID=UPI003AD1CF4D
MSIALFLRNNLKNIPAFIGREINRLPYSFRPGLSSIYKARKKEIELYEKYSAEEKQFFIFNRLKAIVKYSYNNIPFYKEYYDKYGFNPDDLTSFNDISSIPIVTKIILNEYNVEQRSTNTPGRYIVNTGGSSGTPFNFYIEPNSMGHEWAHMHTIWEKLGYNSSDLKLNFAGRSDLKKEIIKYDIIRNSFLIDLYSDNRKIAEKLKKIARRYPIKYLHGYPSSLYEFSLYCNEEDKELKELLSKNLVGAFLGSEFPYPKYRDMIENTFDIKTISWYGHTERCVLAYEKKESFLYEPFQTYGYTEAISNVDKTEYNLVSTSYYNFASPLIRYNTEDTISDITVNDSILNSFKIKKGRAGEFIIDKNGKKINLTGLIFGRHHDLFNYSNFIQVKQIEKGKIEIHFVSDLLNQEKAMQLFDKQNLDLDISFIKNKEPFRSISGKVNLLIR